MDPNFGYEFRRRLLFCRLPIDIDGSEFPDVQRLWDVPEPALATDVGRENDEPAGPTQRRSSDAETEMRGLRTFRTRAMIIKTTHGIRGTKGEVKTEAWASYRLLQAEDEIGRDAHGCRPRTRLA